MYLKSFLFLLIVLHSSAFADIDVEQRDSNISSELEYSHKPSDLLYGDYIPVLEPQSKQIMDNLDLSQGTGKKLYVGYGVYDINENYCKYLPSPDSDDSNFDLDFHSESKYRSHSYFISHNDMTFDQCKDRAHRNGGKVFTPETSAEFNYIYKAKFKGESFWIGVWQDDCFSQFQTESDSRQTYFNWLTEEACEQKNPNNGTTIVKKNIFADSDINGKWRRVEGSSNKKCVIEFDGPDHSRPQKICAPWWRVERKFADHEREMNMFIPFDATKLEQVSVPKLKTICLRYADDEEEQATGDADARRRVQCQSYYSIDAADTCKYDMHSDLCFVDTCKGYIKNACTKVNEYIPFKPYDKGIKLVDGVETVTKTKDRKTIFEYDCPASPKSINSCLEVARVAVYPEKCPDGTYVYGTGDMPPIKNSDGAIVGLQAVCPDGTTVVTSKVDHHDVRVSKCVEYDMVETTQNITQTCTVDRTFMDYIVDAALGEKDIYEDDLECIRMNNLDDARKKNKVVVDYESNGYSRIFIQKAYMAGTKENLFDDNTLSYTVNVTTDSIPVALEAEYTGKTPQQYPNICKSYTLDWDDAVNSSFAPSPTGLELGTTGIFHNDSSVTDGKMYSIPAGVMKYSDCEEKANSGIFNIAIDSSADTYGEDAANVHDIDINELYDANKLHIITRNYTGDVNGTAMDENSTTEPAWFSDAINTSTQIVADDLNKTISGECMLYKLMPSSEEVVFTEVFKNNYGVETKSPSKTKIQCVELALCKGFEVKNFQDFSTGDSVAPCVLESVEKADTYIPITDDNGVVVDYEIWVQEEIPDGPATPAGNIGHIDTEIDGVEDIFSIQEYIPGSNFVAYTSHTSRPYKKNKIEVNGADIDDGSRWATVVEELLWKYNFRQKTTHTKDAPNFSEGSLGEVGIHFLNIGTLGVAVIAGYIDNALSGKDYYLAEQWVDWLLYKEKGNDSLWFEGLYKFDTRKFQFTTDIGEYWKYYSSVGFYSGTLEEPPFAQLLSVLFQQRRADFEEIGISRNQINSTAPGIEKGNVLGFEGCDFWDGPSCTKTRYGGEEKTKKLSKDTTTYFLGSTMGVSIVVPTKGQYFLKAFNRNGMVVAEDEILDNSFVQTVNDVGVANVNFGQNMEIAEGVQDGNTSHACRFSSVAEIGGGVSGIYYEEKNDGIGNICDKSNDAYVKEFSITKVSIRAAGSDKPFYIDLIKPTPYVNNIRVINLGDLEARRYRCYSDFEECGADNNE